MQFKLLTGRHYVREAGNAKKGTVIEAPAVITSDEDLTEKFPNRFERLHENGPQPKKAAKASPAPEPVPEGIAPPTPVPSAASPESEAPEGQTFKAVHQGQGKWDVVNQRTGVKVNAKSLTRAEAAKLATAQEKAAATAASEAQE